ncbi:hypothetical protein CBER1_10986 [Cercospora berteroae]|uniref:Uncharacterized protein n=1 Tax=Cercospora berteroae TaxID=357750 RepID=A0A2S6BXE5_9PEZI|nr:hypothetical protein CBER1_10986 [Cercospora berteroae]
MSKVKFQNLSKAKKERTETLFKKSYELSRIFLHNPPHTGRVAVLVEHDGRWQVFLSDETSQWPINLDAMQPLEIKSVSKMRSQEEANEDRELLNSLHHGAGDNATAEEQQAPSLTGTSQEPLDTLQRSQHTPEIPLLGETEMQQSEEPLPEWDPDLQGPQAQPTTPTIPTSVSDEGSTYHSQAAESMGQRSSRARRLLNSSPTEFNFRRTTRRPIRNAQHAI